MKLFHSFYLKNFHEVALELEQMSPKSIQINAEIVR